MSKQTAITLAGNTISLTRSPAGSNVADLIDKANVTKVSGVFNKKPANGELAYGAVTGTPVIGETFTGGTSGATATLTAFKNTGTFILSSVSGTFTVGETITGGTSGATTAVSALLVSTSYSGEWKYPYTNMTILQIECNDQLSVSIELQDVSNQVTWSTGTLAGLQAAIAAINSFL